MDTSDEQRNPVPPSEQRGGGTPGEAEAAEKGDWAARAAHGVVPADLGGSDAPENLQDADPELGREVLGATTGSDEPATEAGVDPTGGDRADAVENQEPSTPGHGEPDLKDAARGPRQADLESAE